MKIMSLLLVIAVAGFYGCSDKEDTASGEEKTSLLEKAGQLGGEIADKVKQGATEVGETASASLGKVADDVDETIDSVKQVGSQAVESMRREAAAGDDTIDPDQIAMGRTI